MTRKILRASSFLVILCILISACSFGLSAAYEPDFTVYSQAVYMVNVDTGDVIFEKNADQKMYPASLTKIMTVALALENIPDLDGTEIALKLSIQDMLYGTNASLGGILLGESVSVRGLLYAAMLQSANEAALMLADYMGDGSIAKFTEMMNAKAKELGCTGTNFANPNGLHDPNNYTTAKDMAIITKYAMEIPGFMEIANTASQQIGPTNKHESLIQNTTNKMLVRGSGYYYPAVQGIKTGTLPESGRCIASIAQQSGFTYMLIVMGAPIYDEKGEQYERLLNFDDTINLYDWAFEGFEVKTLMEKSKFIVDVPVRLSTKKDMVGLMSAQRFTALVPITIEASSIQLVPEIPEFVNAPIEKGEEIGRVKLILAGEEIGSVPLIANDNIPLSNWLYYLDVAKGVANSFWFKFGLIFVILTLAMYTAIMVLGNKNRGGPRGGGPRRHFRRRL